MPGSTTCAALPYPFDSDRIDVAKDIEKLAKAVDAVLCNVQIPDLDARFVNTTGDTMSGMLTLPAVNPTSDNHAVRKRWVDDFFVHVSGDTMNDNAVLNLRVNAGTNNIREAVSNWYVNSFFLRKDTGGTMGGHINMDGHQLYGLLNPPPSASNAASKAYVDAQDDKHVEVNGDTMTGLLQIGGNPTTTAEGMRLGIDGVINSMHNTSGVSMRLARGSTADAPGSTFIKFEKRSDTEIGSITVRSGQTAVNYNGFLVEPSDYRLKQSYGPVTDALERVRVLAEQVYRGKWKDHAGVVHDFLNAHDVASVAPYAVEGEKDGERMQGVDYPSMVPLLIAAIGELAAKVEAA